MVAKVVRIDGKLMLELDSAAEKELLAHEGGEVELQVGEGAIFVGAVVSPEFDRLARDTLQRHAGTFEKLSK